VIGGQEEVAGVAMSKLNILTINRHTAYLYLLSKTGHNFYVLAAEEWGESAQRPLPSNVNILRGREARINDFDVVIGHDPLYDLLRLGLKALHSGVRYIQVFHGRRQRTGYRRSKVKALVKAAYGEVILTLFAGLKGVRSVFISESVRTSWSLPGFVIQPGIPIDEMMPHNGAVGSLLIVGNDLHREHFDFDAILRLCKSLPVRIVGRNPRIPEARPASSWEELKRLYSTHRAYINVTREPEDGYNLATLEAMASGMPVVTLAHPTSPVHDGYNGLVARNTGELIEKGQRLLRDWKLAKELGINARRTIVSEFSMGQFVRRWSDVLNSSGW
jgi:glycosyltransferase involved in cell wall biosynthesis